jgi:hypothetical protein
MTVESKDAVAKSLSETLQQSQSVKSSEFFSYNCTNSPVVDKLEIPYVTAVFSELTKDNVSLVRNYYGDISSIERIDGNIEATIICEPSFYPTHSTEVRTTSPAKFVTLTSSIGKPTHISKKSDMRVSVRNDEIRLVNERLDIPKFSSHTVPLNGWKPDGEKSTEKILDNLKNVYNAKIREKTKCPHKDDITFSIADSLNAVDYLLDMDNVTLNHMYPQRIDNTFSEDYHEDYYYNVGISVYPGFKMVTNGRSNDEVSVTELNKSTSCMFLTPALDESGISTGEVCIFARPGEIRIIPATNTPRGI